VRLFPDDPFLLRLRGGYHDALASSEVQAFARSSGVAVNIGSAQSELRAAESHYRRALALDDAVDTRIRLGRAPSLQNRHAEALAFLGLLDADAPPHLQYYAALFTGRAAEARGRAGEAREAYERAAALFPRAQAPRFALSHLAASQGDLASATTVLERCWSLT
jgi:tetratricopeptide (TPR) repeat protein